MVDAFGDRGAELLPKCQGRHPHLGRAGHNCDERLRPVLLGASNSWFPVTLTVLAIPTRANRLQQIIQDKWELFEGITNCEILPKMIELLVKTAAVPGLNEHSYNEIWEAIEELRSSNSDISNALVFPDPGSGERNAIRCVLTHAPSCGYALPTARPGRVRDDNGCSARPLWVKSGHNGGMTGVELAQEASPFGLRLRSQQQGREQIQRMSHRVSD